MTPSSTLPKLVSPWSGLTVSRLIESAGRTRASDIIFVDAPDTSTWLHRPARSLTYEALSKETRRFASQMMALGLKHGESVLVLLPNAVEFPIACLGAMLAGMVPVPVAVGTSVDRLRGIAELCNAKAIITVSKLAELDLASLARDLASQVFSVRAVASFGCTLPDGVVSLDDWDEADLAPVGEFPSLGTDDVNLISVECIKDTPRALARTQSQLIAEAMALSSTAQISSKTSVISTIVPGSAFSFISSIILPILVRAQMHFHGVFSSKTLVQQIKASANLCLIAPLAAEEGLSELSPLIQQNINSYILLNRLENSLDPHMTFLLNNSVDVTAIGDAAHLAIPRRGKTMRGALPQNWRQPGLRIVEGDILLVKSTIDEQNRLSLSGFGVASELNAPLGSSIEGELSTEFYAQKAEGQTFVPFEKMDDFVGEELNKKSAA